MLPYSVVAYLQDYRRLYPSDDWVFAGQYKGEALSTRTVQQIMTNAVTKANLEKKAIVHTLRHCGVYPDAGRDYPFAGEWHRYTLHTTIVGTQQYKDDYDLHAYNSKSREKNHQPARQAASR